jgi:hypothetical protein
MNAELEKIGFLTLSILLCGFMYTEPHPEPGKKPARYDEIRRYRNAGTIIFVLACAIGLVILIMRFVLSLFR